MAFRLSPQRGLALDMRHSLPDLVLPDSRGGAINDPPQGRCVRGFYAPTGRNDSDSGDRVAWMGVCVGYGFDR